MAALDWISPQKPRRNEDALFEIAWSTHLSSGLRSAGCRDPDPGRHPQWLHRAWHPENSGRSINPSGVRGTLAFTRIVQQSRRAVPLKIETLIQLVEGCGTKFVSPVALAHFAKKDLEEYPEKLPVYLENAFLSGAYALTKPGFLA